MRTAVRSATIRSKTGGGIAAAHSLSWVCCWPDRRLHHQGREISMVEVEFEFEEGKSPEELEDRLEELQRRVRSDLEDAMQQAVLMVEADAKRNAPVDTGRLRADINSAVERVAEYVVHGYVGNNVDYAIYVELEIQKEGLAYLQPALEENREDIIELFEDAIENSIDEVSRGAV